MWPSAQPRRRPVARSVSIPAPVKGWNARDSIAAMPAGFAVILDNYFPSTASCVVRNGYQAFATGMTNPVESLMEWSGPSSKKLFAGAGTKIWDASSAGAASASVTGLTNVRFSHTMFATSGGNFLFWVNGADAPQYYDGSSWTTPTITGATAANFAYVMAHQRRLFFIEKNTLKFWFLPSESIAGTAASFDLGPLFRLGGHLVACASWTRDGGAGPDDLAVFVTSRGEVAVYAGTDPSSSTDWALQGIFRIDVPVGTRCLLKVGADLAVITTGGVASLGQILPLAQGSIPRVSITNNIVNAFSGAAQSYGSNFGWQIAEYPRGNWFIVNIPVNENALQYQYVMNTLTGAWCRFVNMNACCWSLYGDDIYFGGTDGTVYIADNGTTDNGNDITSDMLPAFSYFGTRTNKRFVMTRPIFYTDGNPLPAIDVRVDFDLSAPTSTPTYASGGGSVWDTAVWDVSSWSTSDVIQKSWQSVYGIGYAASIRMQTATKGFGLSVNSFDLLLEPGGFI